MGIYPSTDCLQSHRDHLVNRCRILPRWLCMCFRFHSLFTPSVSRPRFGVDRHFDEAVSEMVAFFAVSCRGLNKVSSVTTLMRFMELVASTLKQRHLFYFEFAIESAQCEGNHAW